MYFSVDKHFANLDSIEPSEDMDAVEFRSELTQGEYKHAASLQCECGCVEFDVLIDRKPEGKAGICTVYDSKRRRETT